MTAPTVGEYMTAHPHTIGQEQPLSVAHELLRKHKIHHLPVLHGGGLVGVVTMRDLDLLEAMEGTDPTTISVEEAMTTDVYLVAAKTPLVEVIRHMHEHRISSAIIGDASGLKGVFTTVDALKPLLDFLSA